MDALPQTAPSRPAALVALFVFSLLVNAACILFVTGTGIPDAMGDELEYTMRAVEIAGIDVPEFEQVDRPLLWDADMYRTPMWPMMLAGVFSLFGYSTLAGKLSVALLGALTPLGVYLIARYFHAPRQSLLAAYIVACLPSVFFLNATLYSDAPVTATFVWLNVLVFWLIKQATRDGEIRFHALHWLAFGVAFGFVCLIKPAYVVWAGLLFLSGFWIFRRGIAAYLKGILFAGVAFSLVMSPWWLHNYEKSGGHFVPFSTAGDMLISQANNPVIAHMEPRIESFGDRKVWMGPGKFLTDWATSGLFSYEEAAALDEYGMAKLSRDRAWQWIRQNPGTWARLAFQKVGYGLGIWPIWQGSWKILALGIPFVALLLLSLWGWRRVARAGTAGWLLLLSPISFLLTTIIFWGSWRYRSSFEFSVVIAALWPLLALIPWSWTKKT